MQALVLVLHILVALTVIALVLLQQGRGSDVGAAFGSGSSNTMFGSAGALPFLMKLTAILAAVFFVTSIALSEMAAHRMDVQAKVMQLPAAPAATQTNTSKTKTSKHQDASLGISFAPTVGKQK